MPNDILVTIGSGTGLKPVQFLAIIWTNADLLAIELLGIKWSLNAIMIIAIP